ncbi:MAG: helicase-associated domain-containing protein [Salinibacterium sp.]|nr:helicase-associated domain-containing protein [Salinibacterium sp.]
MTASSDTALAFAGHLRSLSDTELVALLGARELREAGIKDFFDLADALLDPTSIQQALSRLDRPTLAVIATLGELGTASVTDAAAHLKSAGADEAALAALPVHLAAAANLALTVKRDGMFTVPLAVGQQLVEWPELDLPSRQELISDPPPTPLAAVSQVDARFTDTVAAERAFGTTTAIVELVSELQHESARELARGGIALPDSKRLAASMNVDIDDVGVLLEIASRAGLAALESGRWMPTAASGEWLLDSSGDRWAALAGAWLDRLPSDIRSILGRSARASWGERLDDYANWLYPAGGDWMTERVRVYTRDAEMLGITAHNQPSTPGVALLAEGPAAASTAMATLFPPEVDKVYLQPDLSVVSPGPLEPALDSRLRAMADVEARAIASTYRISTASLYRAMATGETEATVLDFLTEISLTGIPQPLSYLITDAAARYGLVRVGVVDGDRAYVRSEDDTLLRTLLVDHGVGSLGLTRAGDRLLSRFDRDLVFWTLAEARYPVAAENGEREVVVLTRKHATRTSTQATDSTAALIERLRLGSSSDSDVTDKAWLSRQIDVAIKGKLALTVTIRMPDGTHVDFQLEPASVGGGRMRARDRKSDIERTLPLTSIVSVGPAL